MPAIDESVVAATVGVIAISEALTVGAEVGVIAMSDGIEVDVEAGLVVAAGADVGAGAAVDAAGCDAAPQEDVKKVPITNVIAAVLYTLCERAIYI